MPQAGPAIPSTAAQHGRHDRILAAATAMLAAGGEDALQMKDLSQRAGVSVATLYRYFPAKDHVLLGILLSRYSSALARVTAEIPPGATARDRVTSHLLREFRAEQREPRLTAALSRVISETQAQLQRDHRAGRAPASADARARGRRRRADQRRAAAAAAGRAGHLRRRDPALAGGRLPRRPRPGSRSGSAVGCSTCRMRRSPRSRCWQARQR